MSIPDRLWRVVKGHWALAQERASRGGQDDLADLRVRDRLAELEAQASAYEELAAALRTDPTLPTVPLNTGTRPTATTPSATPSTQGIDPLQAAYELMQVAPGSTLEALDRAYAARLDEVRTDHLPADSPHRAPLEGRRHAIEAAYQRLRDVLNPTETRFERLEF